MLGSGLLLSQCVHFKDKSQARTGVEDVEISPSFFPLELSWKSPWEQRLENELC